MLPSFLCRGYLCQWVQMNSWGPGRPRLLVSFVLCDFKPDSAPLWVLPYNDGVVRKFPVVGIWGERRDSVSNPQ
jgi:hypothetical protein